MPSYRHVVINLIKNIQLLQCNRINFIESIQTRNIFSVTFNYINNVIFSCIAFYEDIRIADSVLFQYGLNCIVADFVSIDHSGDRHPSFILSLEINAWRCFVQSDSKTLQLMLNDFFVLHRSSCIQHYDNEVACSCHCYNLFTPSLAILGSLYDSRQIQQLDLGTFVVQHARNAGQSCEFVCCYLRESSYLASHIPVSLVRRVDLPTEGKPIIPTLASPDFDTSKPSPPGPPFFPPAG